MSEDDGVFGRKKKAAQAAEAERAERQGVLELLEQRLESAENAKTLLEMRLVEVDTANRELASRVSALDGGIGSMSEQLTRLTRMSSRNDDRLTTLEERGGDLDELTTRLHEFTERLDRQEAAAPTSAMTATPPPPPPPVAPPPPPAVDHPADDTRELIVDLGQRLDALVDEVATVDGRVTAISTELANQLTELSSDIEALDERTAAAASQGPDAGDTGEPADLDARIGERVEAALDDVLESTERLANEQARYEIQFRADLAELAERIRRPGASG